MKKLILKTSFAALLVIGTYSCKDKNESSDQNGEVAEASEGAVSYNVDTTASEILWTGKKPLGTHNGTLNLSSGEFYVNNGKIESGKFVIDMASINVEDLEGDDKANLEAHLMGTVEGKQGDFFNVKEHPKATFELTEITGTTGKMNVKGNLTIKEKTNPVEFMAVVTQDENSITLKSDPFMIDRTKWAVNYGSKSVFDGLGDKFIDDDMGIVVDLTAKK